MISVWELTLHSALCALPEEIPDGFWWHLAPCAPGLGDHRGYLQFWGARQAQQGCGPWACGKPKLGSQEREEISLW